ncbi:MAG TPA: hypothetical protein VLV32_08880, partial [Burkholderiales bacterium]|nr:hypothetical protein [Burkholderiales bacterium]
YFEHLCKTEAGEFIYKTVDNVEGFYFMRPPNRPTDDELMDRYKLEAPDIERMFQLYRATPGDRSTIFIIPGIRFYRYVEEKNPVNNQFERAFGFEPGTTRPKQVEQTPDRKSRYGLIWRGVKRPRDRENIIAGNEWIVLDLMNNEVLAVFRNYARTGRVPNAPGGVWWLNAVQCPDAKPVVSAGYLGQQLYELIEAVLIPVKKDTK